MMELMKEAGLNTILGMGMTFLVLILLSGIITMFGRAITAFQNKAASDRKKELKESAPQEVREVPAPAAPAPAGDGDLMAVLAAAVAAFESDTMSPEIAAVIAAAVAAYEGSSGYVVRKIRKSRKHVA